MSSCWPHKILPLLRISGAERGIVPSVAKHGELPQELTARVHHLSHGAKEACKQAKEMARQATCLESDMRRTEADLRATRRVLQRTKRKADRLHRKLVSGG